jgi:hypothetical protein
MLNSWKTKALGGRRLDPTVGALLGNAAWVLFGWTEESDEALCLNLHGAVFQTMYLGTFVALCTNGERVRAAKRVAGALLILGVTMLHGGNLELHKLLCTLCSMLGAAMPLLNFILVLYFSLLA